MDGIGETLREARHSKRITIADAARVTKIKPEVLEHLEAEEFSRLPSPAYVRGFLKIYAEYLGLDSNAIVEAYVRSQGGLRRHGLRLETEATLRSRPPRELQLSLRSVVLLVSGLTALAVLLVAARVWWQRHGAVEPPAAAAPAGALPRADFEAYYQPNHSLVPETLDVPTSR